MLFFPIPVNSRSQQFAGKKYAKIHNIDSLQKSKSFSLKKKKERWFVSRFGIIRFFNPQVPETWDGPRMPHGGWGGSMDGDDDGTASSLA